MQFVVTYARWAQRLLYRLQVLDFMPSLLLRVYLAPIFWMAGTEKLKSFDSTVEWFGNPEWGLGLPAPVLMASLAIFAEIGGAISLVLGLALRWMCIPMMFTMIVATFSVHWMNGWLAIAEGMGTFATERTMQAHERLQEAKQILMEHGDYDRLTEFGNLVILNNGIEFAVTYLVMLLALAFLGAGRWISLDYWIWRRYMKPRADA